MDLGIFFSFVGLGPTGFVRYILSVALISYRLSLFTSKEDPYKYSVPSYPFIILKKLEIVHYIHGRHTPTQSSTELTGYSRKEIKLMC